MCPTTCILTGPEKYTHSDLAFFPTYYPLLYYALPKLRSCILFDPFLTLPDTAFGDKFAVLCKKPANIKNPSHLKEYFQHFKVSLLIFGQMFLGDTEIMEIVLILFNILDFF